MLDLKNTFNAVGWSEAKVYDDSADFIDDNFHIL